MALNWLCINARSTLKVVYADTTSVSVVFARRTPSAGGFARERLMYSR